MDGINFPNRFIRKDRENYTARIKVPGALNWDRKEFGLKLTGDPVG